MDNAVKKALEWVFRHPISVAFSTILALFGYTNIFLFGFLLNVPIALRPFLDSYFFSTLAIEFFVDLALAAFLAKTILLVLRFTLATSKIKTSRLVFPFFGLIDKLFGIGAYTSELDKRARVNVKLVARWLRRQRIGVLFMIGLLVFSFLFVGWHSLWFLPLCIVSAPLVWMLMSKVELRRNFATPKNTQVITASRVYRAYAGFAVIYFAVCVFLAGFANFAEKLDTSVSVGIGGNERITSVLGVTSAGVIVGEGGGFVVWPKPHFFVSAHFLPYGSFGSIGQRH